LSPPLYVLPHGIEVIGEYRTAGQNPYWRVRVRPHHFFPNVKPVSNGLYIRRSRVVMASKLGRSILETELVHHIDEDKDNDHPDNLEVIDVAAHNRHHKTGTKHTEASKRAIGASVKLSYMNNSRKRKDQ